MKQEQQQPPMIAQHTPLFLNYSYPVFSPVTKQFCMQPCQIPVMPYLMPMMVPMLPHFHRAPVPQEDIKPNLNEDKKSRKRKATEAIDEVHPRPIWTFASLSLIAILNSPSHTVSTDEIYKFILKNFPFFEKQLYSSWTGAIRHNLAHKKHLFQWIPVPGQVRIGKWTIISIEAAKTEILKEIKIHRQPANTGFRNKDDFGTLVTGHLEKPTIKIETPDFQCKTEIEDS